MEMGQGPPLLYLLWEKSNSGIVKIPRADQRANAKQIRRLFCFSDSASGRTMHIRFHENINPSLSLPCKNSQVCLHSSYLTISQEDLEDGGAIVEVGVVPSAYNAYDSDKAGPKVTLRSWGPKPVYVIRGGESLEQPAIKLDYGSSLMDIVAGDWLVGPYGLYDRFTFFFSTDANLPYKKFHVMGTYSCYPEV
jgi:hypothetical protein